MHLPQFSGSISNSCVNSTTNSDNRPVTGDRHDYGTYSQYSYPTCCRLEVASDNISGTFVRKSGINEDLKFGDPQLNCPEKFDSMLADPIKSQLHK